MTLLSPVVSLIVVSVMGLLALISLVEWRRRRNDARDHARYVDALRALDDDALAARVQETVRGIWPAPPPPVVEALQRSSGWTAPELQVAIRTMVTALQAQGGRSLFLALDSGLGTLSDVVNERVRQQSGGKRALGGPP